MPTKLYPLKISSEKKSTIDLPKIGFLLLPIMAVFFLLPVNKFTSGGPQFVDIPLVIVIAIVFLSRYKLNDNILKIFYLFIPFLIIVILSNGGHYLVKKDLSMLIAAITLIYAIIIMFAFTKIFAAMLEHNNIFYIYLGLLLSIIACLTFKGLNEEAYETVRASMSFNKPNQLAYFAVLLSCFLIFLQNFRQKNNISNNIYILMDMIIFIILHYLVMISVSRGGIITVLVLDVCLILNIKDKRVLISIAIAILLMITMLIIINTRFKTFIADKMELRKDQIDAKGMIYNRDGMIARVLEPLKVMHGIDFIIGRGYTLRKEKPDSQIISTKYNTIMEVHNIFFDIFRSYGLIGLLLFIIWIGKVLRMSLYIKDGLWVMLSLLLYNMASNGIRFRFFWIFMAFLMALINHSYNQSKRSEGSSHQSA